MQAHTEPNRFPNRKHPRLRNYDYSAENYYFVTICTENKQCLFGEPHGLNASGLAAVQTMEEIPLHFPGVSVDQYVVMPNHVHAILILRGGAHLSTVVGQYKAAVTKRIPAFAPHKKVWQPSFHDHIIRCQKDYERIWLYIESNPQNWIKDCFFEDSSKQNLTGGVMTPPYKE